MLSHWQNYFTFWRFIWLKSLWNVLSIPLSRSIVFFVFSNNFWNIEDLNSTSKIAWCYKYTPCFPLMRIVDLVQIYLISISILFFISLSLSRQVWQQNPLYYCSICVTMYYDISLLALIHFAWKLLISLPPMTSPCIYPLLSHFSPTYWLMTLCCT